MPTKKIRKAKKTSNLVKHEPNIKAILSLLVFGLAFGVFYLFFKNQEELVGSSSLQFFMVLVVVLFALLIYLLYLVNPRKK